jgi:hypothetical protein
MNVRGSGHPASAALVCGTCALTTNRAVLIAHGQGHRCCLYAAFCSCDVPNLSTDAGLCCEAGVTPPPYLLRSVGVMAPA